MKKISPLRLTTLISYHHYLFLGWVGKIINSALRCLLYLLVYYLASDDHARYGRDVAIVFSCSSHLLFYVIRSIR
ncbi:hypothetical protein F5Y11DRAFT_130414 [Daldinia sp. FL1419]|nr:hypothetical protein F5Y11DRAFT_130414 [Daldinia sp. FL1419]